MSFVSDLVVNGAVYPQSGAPVLRQATHRAEFESKNRSVSGWDRLIDSYL
jgi:hypothetical protein